MFLDIRFCLILASFQKLSIMFLDIRSALQLRNQKKITTRINHVSRHSLGASFLTGLLNTRAC